MTDDPYESATLRLHREWCSANRARLDAEWDALPDPTRREPLTPELKARADAEWSNL